MRITRFIGIIFCAFFLMAQTSMTVSAGLPGQNPGSWYGSTSSNLSPVTDVVNVVVYGQFRGFNHVQYLIERSGHGWGTNNIFTNGIYGRDTNQTRTQDSEEARGDFFCQSNFCRNHFRLWSDRCSWTCTTGGATANQPTIIMASYEMFVGALNGTHKVTDFDNAAHDVWHDVLQTCGPLHTSCTNQYLVTGVYNGGSISGAQPDPVWGWRSANIHYSGNVYTFTLN